MRILSILPSLLLIGGCVSTEPVAAPGIQLQEHQVLLASVHVGSPDQERLVRLAVHGDSAALHRFLSLAPRVDGELAEGYQTRLWQILFELGDTQFAEAVDRESQPVRTSLRHFIRRLLQSHPELTYPETSRLFAAVMPPSNQALERTASRCAARMN